MTIDEKTYILDELKSIRKFIKTKCISVEIHASEKYFHTINDLIKFIEEKG